MLGILRHYSSKLLSISSSLPIPETFRPILVSLVALSEYFYVLGGDDKLSFYAIRPFFVEMARFTASWREQSGSGDKRDETTSLEEEQEEEEEEEEEEEVEEPIGEEGVNVKLQGLTFSSVCNISIVI
jgi:hypothetical protein